MSEVITSASGTVPARAAGSRATRASHLPGEAGIWVFILSDLMLFSALFLAYSLEKASGKGHLGHGPSIEVGAIETVLLLTSSLLVANAVRGLRRQRRTVSRRYIALAMLCGIGFAALKAFEWTTLSSAGFDLTADRYFVYYYALTGMHMVHVVIGLCVLTAIARRLRRPAHEHDLRFTESGASYWHMVDLIWVVVFAVLYVSVI